VAQLQEPRFEATIPQTEDNWAARPVRSAFHKPQIGRLVVKWVTISEFLLLYFFLMFLVVVLGLWGVDVEISLLAV